MNSSAAVFSAMSSRGGFTLGALRANKREAGGQQGESKANSSGNILYLMSTLKCLYDSYLSLWSEITKNSMPLSPGIQMKAQAGYLVCPSAQKVCGEHGSLSGKDLHFWRLGVPRIAQTQVRKPREHEAEVGD